MTDLLRHENRVDFHNPAARDFLNRCLSLDTGCHTERSIKLSSSGEMFSRRILLGSEVHRLSSDQWRQFFLSLGLPEGACQKLMVNFNKASSVLFGIEETEVKAVTFKIYLEFWDDMIKKIQAVHPVQEPVPLNHGLKWVLGRPTEWVEDVYWCFPRLNDHQIIQRLGRLVSAPDGLAVIKALEPLFRVNSAMDKLDLVYLEVADQNNLRRSFDLNCYRREMTVGDIQQALITLGNEWAIDQHVLQGLIDQFQECPLGHVSGGYNRIGQSFFTFYFES